MTNKGQTHHLDVFCSIVLLYKGDVKKVERQDNQARDGSGEQAADCFCQLFVRFGFAGGRQ